MLLAAVSDPTVLVNYGFAAVAAGSIALFARELINRALDRADGKDAEVQRLNQSIQDQVVPAMTAQDQTLREVVALLADIQRQRQIDDAVARDRKDGGR